MFFPEFLVNFFLHTFTGAWNKTVSVPGFKKYNITSGSIIFLFGGVGLNPH
jgi:hypothetical protein